MRGIRNRLRVQWGLGSAWASAQSDRGLRCALIEYLRALRAVTTLIGLGGGPGGSGSSLNAGPKLLVFPRSGSL